jgi:hypothetical protein
MKLFLLSLMLVFSGCSILPKPVEYFQDRVQSVPERTKPSEESLRQAARLAADRAAQTERAALVTQANVTVLEPARDTAKLAASVSDRIGPPLNPYSGEIDALVTRMDAQEARYQRELSSYRDQVQDNVGKPIEGTGAIQIGYFAHLLILGSIFIVAWMIVKIIAIFNAPVAVGLKTVENGSRFLGRAFSEVIEAGQDFKTRLRKRLVDQPELAESLISDFTEAHRANQSRDVQEAVVRLKG